MVRGSCHAPHILGGGALALHGQAHGDAAAPDGGRHQAGILQLAQVVVHGRGRQAGGFGELEAGQVGLRAQLASAAAWSPNPNNPPLYLDLPFGATQQAVLARWAANAPLAFIDQYVSNLRTYRGIAIDVGDQDGLKTDTSKLHDVLASYSIAHEFEIYPGTHTSDVAVRFQDHVIPFFSGMLAVDQKGQHQGTDRR